MDIDYTRRKATQRSVDLEWKFEEDYTKIGLSVRNNPWHFGIMRNAGKGLNRTQGLPCSVIPRRNMIQDYVRHDNER